MVPTKRVLLAAATTGYQARAFQEAARKLGIELGLATDRCDHLEDPWGDQAIPVRFERPEQSAEELIRVDRRWDGIVAVGDGPAKLAAYIAAKLHLPFHPPEAVSACGNKFLARERFQAAGLPVPEFYRVPLNAGGAEAARSARYPCVLKPLGLSASRGVIRANDEAEFLAAFLRNEAILRSPDVRRQRDDASQFLQIESFIPGREYALEGLVTGGRLHVLTIFDKPDPLDGPFFEETIYTAPSRASNDVVNCIADTAQRAVSALGLTHGPVHAEMRVNESGVSMLEAAARPIGGLCAKALRFEAGQTLEDVILRHALDSGFRIPTRERNATGVMMIPVPVNGLYIRHEGQEEAEQVPGIDEVIITAKQGQRFLKLPEGHSYPGFIFARGTTPMEVEAALRTSHSKLRFEMATELATLRP